MSLPPLVDPTWLLTPAGIPVLQAALGLDARGNVPQARDGLVTVTVPQDFVFHADHFHTFRFVAGTQVIPAALLEIPYIRARGVVEMPGTYVPYSA